jgi:hypothetical protein
MPLPEIYVHVAIGIHDFGTQTLNIIERKWGEQPEVVTSSSDLVFQSLSKHFF